MSLIPMATEWMGLNPYKSLPALFYGIILFMCAVSYNIVQAEVIKINGKDSQIFRNIGNDLKGKLSIIAYAAAIIFAFYFPVISYLIYIAIALTWIVPDSRLEKAWWKRRKRKWKNVLYKQEVIDSDKNYIWTKRKQSGRIRWWKIHWRKHIC